MRRFQNNFSHRIIHDTLTCLGRFHLRHKRILTPHVGQFFRQRRSDIQCFTAFFVDIRLRQEILHAMLITQPVLSQPALSPLTRISETALYRRRQ